MEPQIQLIENGAPVPLKGELVGASPVSRWRGFPLEMRMMPRAMEVANIQCPNAIIMMSSTITGRTDIRSGVRCYSWDILPGNALLHEAGFEIDRGKWRCSEGLSILIDLSAAHVASLLPDRSPPTLPGEQIDDRALTTLIEAMRIEVEDGCRSGCLYAEGLSIALLGFLSERMPASFATPDFSLKTGTGHRLSPATVQRICDYVEENLASDLSISTLSGLANLSPYYFARAFKTTSGASPHGFVLERRVEQAARLLHGSFSLADISSMVGFSSQSHFTRVFRQKTGVTPARFRDSLSGSKRNR